MSNVNLIVWVYDVVFMIVSLLMKVGLGSWHIAISDVILPFFHGSLDLWFGV